jgi:lipoate-protein ligase A
MWDRHLVGGTVADLHHRDLPLDRRGIWVMEATTPTLVLGSAQPDDAIDAARARAAGWAWTRRRTGGGLVALDPAQVVWIDVVVPADDPLWRAAFAWLGEAWVAALGSLGASSRAHDGPAQWPDEGRVVCFAGLGHGEVTTDGRKLVGLSQRRTSIGARFQCLAHLRWEPGRWWPFVADALAPDLRQAIEEAMAHRVAELGERTPDGTSARDAVIAAFVSELLDR